MFIPRPWKALVRALGLGWRGAGSAWPGYKSRPRDKLVNRMDLAGMFSKFTLPTLPGIAI
eukprot:5142454-Prymnesium_polylepis.1